MDIERQTNEMLNSFAQVQQRLLDRWTGVMQNFQARPSDREFWERWEQVTERPIQVWQEQTRNLMDSQMRVMLNAQSLWTRHWLDNLNPSHYLPTLLDNWFRQAQQIAEKQAEVNRQAIERLLETSQQIDTRSVVESWGGVFERSMDALEDVSRRTLEEQEVLGQQMEKQLEEGSKKVAGTTKKAAGEEGRKEEGAGRKSA